MMNGFGGKIICEQIYGSVLKLKRSFVEHLGIPGHEDDFYVTENGRKVDENTEATVGSVYRFHPRLVGGKGGFGSMLRALGAQIEKTTNREACRDLSGRRMRDVNNEKKLKEWVEKAPEREREKKEKEEGKKKKKTAEVKYFYDGTTYDKQKEKIQENFDDALKQALKGPIKRKPEKKEVPLPKDKNWFGIDLDDTDDSSDDDDDEEEGPQKAKKPKLEDDDGGDGPSCSGEGKAKEKESTSHDASDDDDSQGDDDDSQGDDDDDVSSSNIVDKSSEETKEVAESQTEEASK